MTPQELATAVPAVRLGDTRGIAHMTTYRALAKLNGDATRLPDETTALQVANNFPNLGNEAWSRIAGTTR